MEYTIKEQMMIKNFKDLYFLALADKMDIEDKEDFDLMIAVNEPRLDKIVKDFKMEHFPNKEMGKEFGSYTTSILAETFDVKRVAQIVQFLEMMQGGFN